MAELAEGVFVHPVFITSGQALELEIYELGKELAYHMVQFEYVNFTLCQF